MTLNDEKTSSEEEIKQYLIIIKAIKELKK